MIQEIVLKSNSKQLLFLLSMPKYLFIARSCLLEGTIIPYQPSDNDLVLSEPWKGVFRVILDGVNVAQKLTKLVTTYDYKLILTSKSKEAGQIDATRTFEKACLDKNIKYPGIYAIAVRDAEQFPRVVSDKPEIIKDRSHGILIAGYDIEEDGKACVRKALSALLSISESTRKNHLIVEDFKQIQEAAAREGWRTKLIDQDHTMNKVIDELLEEESKRKSSRYSTLQPNKPSEIKRVDNDFSLLGKCNSGSYIFKRNSSGTEWIGKPCGKNITESDIIAKKQKVASEFYERYGAMTPKIELSRQKSTDANIIHLMKEVDPNVKTYEEVCGDKFDPKNPIPEGKIVDKAGKTIEERGLGKMLAIAALINETEAFGDKGENIGIRKTPDQAVAETVKLDFGNVFEKKEDDRPKRSIRVSKGAVVEFDKLPTRTKKEFLETLVILEEEDETEFTAFFNRVGLVGEKKVMSDLGSTAEEITKWVVTRRQTLLNEYAPDLKKFRLFDLGENKIQSQYIEIDDFPSN